MYNVQRKSCTPYVTPILRTREFLSNLNNAAKRHNFFEPNFTPGEIGEIPGIYKKLVEEPLALEKSVQNAGSKSVLGLVKAIKLQHVSIHT